MNLLEVIEHYRVNLEQRGLEYWASCPFHEDGDPSFSVSPKEDGYVFHCFSCKAGGGPIQFIQNYEKIGYKQAKKIYYKLSGKDYKVKPEQELLTSIVEFLQVEDHPYLSGRGISKEAIKHFGIGFCDDYYSVLDHFELSEADGEELGLWNFSNSILYPYFDADGCFKFHTRRVDEKQYIKKKGPLYKESLWGIDDIRGEKVYLFEGFHDAMVAWQAGYPAVATAGTNMFGEYWKELKERGIRKLVFVPDGDMAGTKMLDKIVDTFDPWFLIDFIVVPSGDPDDAILEGRFENFNKISIFEWVIERKMSGHQDITSKLEGIRNIRPIYLKLGDAERVLFKQIFREKFGNDEVLDYLYDEVEPDLQAERIVIANCIYSKNVKYDTMHEIDQSYFHTRQFKNLFEFIRDHEEISSVLVQKEFNIDFSNFADLLNYKKYIEIVKDIGIKEKTIRVLNSGRINLNTKSFNEIIGRITEQLYSLADSSINVTKADSVVKKVMNNISERVHNPQVTGIALNEEQFPILNKTLMGWIPKKFILISGPTGHGKTTLACNFLDDLIFEKNEKVGFFTLEMSDEEIIEKQLAIRTGVAGAKIMTGSLEQSEYDAIVETAQSFISSNLYIIQGSYDLYKIVSIARSLMIRKNIKYFVIDYLQLIMLDNRNDRWQQLMEITKTIKTGICNYGATVLGISQLGKNSLKSYVADAADQSGSYGMLADVDTAVTVRQKPFNEIKDGVNFEIFVSKHRYGLDKVLIESVFDKGTQKIKEVN